MKISALIIVAVWVLTPVRSLAPATAVSDFRSRASQDTARQEIKRYVYVGVETCATRCHNTGELGFQYEIWKLSPHARSFQALLTGKAARYAKKAGIGGKPSESPYCLRCHVTAFEVDTASIGKSYRKEDGVTCEACHKAEFRPSTFLPVESDCIKCHNSSVHTVPQLDFDRDCKKISHPRPQ